MQHRIDRPSARLLGVASLYTVYFELGPPARARLGALFPHAWLGRRAKFVISTPRSHILQAQLTGYQRAL
ncbi:hypothetical protein M404DRAFT_1009133, partial [Pisolithus tinctorius Marx 270]